ncbi:MAG: diadenylate cyclase CdaA [Caldilineales bacterium]
MLDFLPLDRLPENLAYLLYSVRQIETVFDLLLVSLTYFGILIVVRRSQAAVLLRGILILALFAVGVSALLQLPTFTWVLRAALVLGLIATPLIFQPELRRGLERLGRTLGFLQIRPTELVHRVVPVLLRVTTNLSQRRVGGLIVLEGTTELNDVIGTGVPLHADLSADLLETIFQDKTPLHDGAVLVREDRVVAAACVLPLSEHPLPDGMHQGTRHRAALGISETSNCLAVVVSEETGAISVAENGVLHHDLDSTELREYLYRFYDPLRANTNGVKGLIAVRRSSRRQDRPRRTPRAMLIDSFGLLATFLTAMLLAVATWLIVANQVNPPQNETIGSIALRLTNQPKDLLVVSDVPQTVTANIQAPQDAIAAITAQSFRATADLATLGADVHRVPISVTSNDERVRVISVDPSALDVELQPKASQTLTVAVTLLDRETLPFSYDVAGDVTASPTQLVVTGPSEVVDQIARAEATIQLKGARSTVREDRPVVLKDAAGNVLTGLTTDPETVQVTVPINQRFNTRDTAVHVVITGTVAPGYWISNINVVPNNVTLLGPPTTLESIGSFVDTIPVDVSGVAGEIVRRVPLAPPASVTPLNESGVTEGSVEVTISVVPQQGNLRLTVPVEVTGLRQGDTVGRSPSSVDVLLAGPLPILNQINADNKLVRVVVDVTELAPGVHTVTPTLIFPEGLRTTVVPNSVQLRIERPTPTPEPISPNSG